MEEVSSPTPDNDNYPLINLPKRYSVSQTVINDRTKALHIKPHKQSKKLYLNCEQLSLMDDLDAHLKAGGEIEEFVREQIANGKIVIQFEQTEAIVVRPDAEVVVTHQLPQELMMAEEIEISAELSQPEWVAELQSQKEERIDAADIQVVDERAQKRAFNHLAAEETLTVMYEKTEEFTLPGYKEKLEQHREACRQARGKRSHNFNDFLAKSLALNPAFQTKKVRQSNGLPNSTTSNSDCLT